MQWERRAWDEGKLLVAGVDEAGRGAWAGPLVAAAVILPCDPRERARITLAIKRAGTEIRDSKQLSASQRQRAIDVLYALGIPHAVTVIEVGELDAIGLGAANKAVLCRAVAALTPEPEHVLVDAFRLESLSCTHDPIIQGDNLSQTIALASIVAKLHRDALMAALDAEHSLHGFATHKGYGTAAHRAAIERHGITPQHRTSFAPIAEFLANGVAYGAND
ncbi:MAG: ribonuclease HII [Chloroflexota bacterium]|nr:ribonuclease HII [Chloroflexota bacterium]